MPDLVPCPSTSVLSSSTCQMETHPLVITAVQRPSESCLGSVIFAGTFGGTEVEVDQRHRDPSQAGLHEGRCSHSAGSATPTPSGTHRKVEGRRAAEQRLVHFGPVECKEFDVITGELGSAYSRSIFFKKQRKHTLRSITQGPSILQKAFLRTRGCSSPDVCYSEHQFHYFERHAPCAVSP